MNDKIIQIDNKIIALEFPIIKKSEFQDTLFKIMKKCYKVDLNITRRGGKSAICALRMFDFLINDGSLLKEKEIHICSHSKAQQLYQRFYNEWFVACLGDIKHIPYFSLDNLYIPLPERYIKYLSENKDNLNSNELEWWFGKNKNNMPYLLNVENLNTPFVKLFHTNMGATTTTKKGDTLYSATIFNGAVIQLISANQNFDDYTSGKTVKFFWGEELGVWKEDYLGDKLIPSILEAGGVVINSFTPNKDTTNPKSHWTYKKMIEPINRWLSDGTARHFYKKGMDIYITGGEKYVDKLNQDKLSSISTALVIGKLSNIFFYSHKYKDGGNLFELEKILSAINEEVILNLKKD